MSANDQHQHDPQAIAFLNDLAKTRSELDRLHLDNAEKDRQIAAADAKIKHLEKILSITQAQRDTYLGKVIEITTHMGEIEHHYERLRMATAAVVKMRNTPMPDAPGDETGGAANGSGGAAAAEAKHERVARSFAQPHHREQQPAR